MAAFVPRAPPQIASATYKARRSHLPGAIFRAMTHAAPNAVEPFGTRLTTKAGDRVLMGTGTGTKWQKIKKARPSELQHTLVDELVEQLVTSVDNGFRHIDTAEIYTTHPEVAAALARSAVPREHLFVTTKYNPGVAQKHLLHASGALAVDAALRELGTDYIDLFLVHFPFFNPEYSHGQTLESVWADLVEAKRAGKVRYIGALNFAREHLERVARVAGPEFQAQVNQIEFHPYLQNQSPGVVDYCREQGILVEAYGPLSPLFRLEKDGEAVEAHPLQTLVPELAAKYGKTDAQVLLRYTLQKGLLPVTTSSLPQRQREALAAYDFALDDADVKRIDDAGSEFSFRGFFHGYFD